MTDRAATIAELQRRILAHEQLQARIAQALGLETWQGDLADAVAASLPQRDPAWRCTICGLIVDLRFKAEFPPPPAKDPAR